MQQPCLAGGGKTRSKCAPGITCPTGAPLVTPFGGGIAVERVRRIFTAGHPRAALEIAQISLTEWQARVDWAIY